MSIDDRLRAAQQRQLDAVERRVATDRAGSPATLPPSTRPPAKLISPQPRRYPPLLGPVLAMAAVVVVVVGAALIIGLPDRTGRVETVEPATPSPGDDAPTTAPDSPSTPDPAAAPPSTTSSTGSSAASSAVSSAGPAPPSTATRPPSTTGDGANGSPASSAASSPDSGPGSTVDGTGAAVPSEVCGSGFRAPLEDAALRYVSEERGWNRLADLVDEQDGPHYNLTDWEPGYPGLVSVELTLAQPVAATEIRVAQNPHQEVSGTIEVEVEAVGRRIELELSGMGGWQAHTFAEPTMLDTLTITRNDARSNIVELVVCATP